MEENNKVVENVAKVAKKVKGGNKETMIAMGIGVAIGTAVCCLARPVTNGATWVFKKATGKLKKGDEQKQIEAKEEATEKEPEKADKSKKSK